MVDPVKSFLEARRKDLELEVRDLERRLGAAREELSRIDRAVTAIGIVNGLRIDNAPESRRAVVQPGTIKDFIVQVLSDHPDGLIALELLGEINGRFGTQYPRTSLSPQLSRLGQAGVLGRRGLVWYLQTPPKQAPEGTG